MLTNEELRKEVRMLKATHRISFKAFAETNNFKVSSFYNWLRGDFDYTDHSCEIVNNAIQRVKEGMAHA